MKFLIFIPTFNNRVLIHSIVKSLLDLGVEFFTLFIDARFCLGLEMNGMPGHRDKHVRCRYNAGLGVATNIALDNINQMKCEFSIVSAKSV